MKRIVLFIILISIFALSANAQVVGPDVIMPYLDVLGWLKIHGAVTTSSDVTVGGNLTVTEVTEQLRLGYDATNYATFTVADDGLLDIVTVDPDGAEADICFNPDGNAGIGTTSPTEKLHVYGHILANRDASTDLRLGTGLARVTGNGNNLILRCNSIQFQNGDDAAEKIRFSMGSGNIGIGTTSPQGKTQWSDSDTHGGLILNTYYATSGTFTADHTITIEVNVPSGAKIVGVQLHIKAALAGGETWNAQYVTGATQSIGTAQAVAQNTNLSTFFDVNTDTDIASAETDITIQRSSNPGVDAFSAQGEIEAVVYAWVFDTWDNE